MSSKSSSPGQCQCAGAVVKVCSLAFQPRPVRSSPACPARPVVSKPTLPAGSAAMGGSDRPTSSADGSALAPVAAPTPAADAAWRSCPPRGSSGYDHSSPPAVSAQTASAAGRRHRQGETPQSPDFCPGSIGLPDATPRPVRHAEIREASLSQSQADSSMCDTCACITIQTLPDQSQTILPFPR